jgi:hypothetical protein
LLKNSEMKTFTSKRARRKEKNSPGCFRHGSLNPDNPGSQAPAWEAKKPVKVPALQPGGAGASRATCIPKLELGNENSLRDFFALTSGSQAPAWEPKDQ